MGTRSLSGTYAISKKQETRPKETKEKSEAELCALASGIIPLLRFVSCPWEIADGGGAVQYAMSWEPVIKCGTIRQAAQREGAESEGESDSLVDRIDVGEDFIAAEAGFRTGDEVRGKLLPLLAQLVHIGFGLCQHLGFGKLVGLGEHDAEGNAVLSEPGHKLQVDSLSRVTDVDEQEEVAHLLALEDVAVYHTLKLILVLLASLGIAIAREIDQEPLLIYKEMVDENGLAGSGRRLGQLAMIGEHVDETGFAHVASAYEGIFRQVGLGALAYQRAADGVFCRFYLHGVCILCEYSPLPRRLCE